jgi:CubicO group peptidase (beta-lactamase class C family)
MRPFILALPLLLAACGSYSPDRFATTATGFVSHQLCSAVFVSGLDGERFYGEAIAPTLSPLGGLVSHRVDRDAGTVTARLGGIEARAVYRASYGCTLDLPPPPAFGPMGPSVAAPASVVEPAAPALRAILDREFAPTPDRAPSALVILQDGRIVAERYAPGFGVTTPVHGWSATKSVTNALLGILVRQGRISMDAAAPVPEWADQGDPRHAITIDQLLRMTSGLDIGDSLDAGFLSGFDPAAQMLFGRRDMAGWAAQGALAAPPGTRWTYTDGNTLILSRIIRDQAGGDAAATLAFARAELFDKTGMAGATLEFDGAGTPLGGSHMYAPARARARFGQLYLDDGMAGGQRLLPPGWVEAAARATPAADRFGYGAGFWTNRGGGEGAQWRIDRGMPADAFMARGSFGQYVVIVPSARLVIARFGTFHTRYGDIDAMNRLVADTVAALR